MKKNNWSSYLTFVFILSVIFFAASCDFEDVSGPDPDPDPDPDPEPVPTDTVGTVPPDGILETVTWNIENFNGDPTTVDNAIKIIDSLKADLFAFEEINDESALDDLTERMKGYRGFIAPEPSNTEAEFGGRHTAFAFNTNTIDSVSSGLIIEGQNEFDWASGRFPFFFSFDYTFQDITVPIYAVVIHSKCCDDQESYQRRRRAAQSLYTFLTRNKPDANIVFLGDYNDDVDESINEGSETPYQPFVEDKENFLVITKSLSQEGQTTTVGFEDAIDHITVSNEMEEYYILGSETPFIPTDDFIDDYGDTTSDHYPVRAEFDIR